ncbi:MAG: hypothetical protein QF923_05480, partial [Candidatus Marinimicrobia bacterium]|nr:hypothetical protein [Candidatus Neomarinimicrobiota bacterium]
PTDYKSVALPAELRWHAGYSYFLNHPIQANLTVEKSIDNDWSKIRKCKAFKIRYKIEYPARVFYKNK